MASSRRYILLLMQFSKLSRPKLSTILFGGSIILLLFAGSITLQQQLANNRANNAAQKAVALANAGHSSPAPATTKPSLIDTTSYTVPATHPRYLLIPSLAVRARVMATGLTKDNAIGTPSNVYDTAWYTGSSLPGAPGATLIDGHLSSWTTHGVFYDLKLLKIGDMMQLQLGNGVLLTYRIARTQFYTNTDVDVPTLLKSAVDGRTGLNLITCAGDVINGSHEFSKRLVIYAVQV
jgi:LPXTG-site transpeptidase (sortase) family protein